MIAGLRRAHRPGGQGGARLCGEPSATTPALLSLASHAGRCRSRDSSSIARRVAREMPLVGFYLQPAVGGIVLAGCFWLRFAAIDNVVAIKVAPFNRYRTLDVVRGVVEAGSARSASRSTPATTTISCSTSRSPSPSLATARAGRGQVQGRTVSAIGAVWTQKAVALLDAKPRARPPRQGNLPDGGCWRADSRVTGLQRAPFSMSPTISAWLHRSAASEVAATPARPVGRHLAPRAGRGAQSGASGGDRPRSIGPIPNSTTDDAFVRENCAPLAVNVPSARWPAASVKRVPRGKPSGGYSPRPLEPILQVDRALAWLNACPRSRGGSHCRRAA